MTISAKVDLTTTPPTLTVTSDKRKVSVSVSSNGETATGTATYPVVVTDSSGKVWKPVSDDGSVATFQ